MIARPSTKRTPPGRPAVSADGTRIRLLKAAARVFAEHGYQDATVRQICERAGANIALVNYHFGDKLELYTEVLRFSLQPGRARSPIRSSARNGPTRRRPADDDRRDGRAGV